MDDDTDLEYRDYAAELIHTIAGCTTPDEVRKALWDAGLHVGRRPPDSVGKDWRVGLLEAIETVEEEDSAYVVACTHALSMALLDDVRDVEGLKAERQAVIHAVNLYGDDVLHDALDAIGFAPRDQ